MNSPTPPTPTRSPRRGRLTALVTINALLLCAVLGGLLAPLASAQPGGGGGGGGSPRARGNYLMVSGRASGQSANLVYVVDTVNQELLALRYQRSSGRLEPMGYRNLAADSAMGAQNR